MSSDSLLAIEEIRQLKARYFRCIDTRDWAGFRSLHETYERCDGRWRIRSLRLTRLRVDVQPFDGNA